MYAKIIAHVCIFLRFNFDAQKGFRNNFIFTFFSTDLASELSLPRTSCNIFGGNDTPFFARL